MAAARAHGRLAYLPGLDGLRGLAVMAVLIYHAEPRWLPGGYLGVEVFFVLSGYLITGLLLAEWQRSGRISVTGFWLRRARRLLPALFTLMSVTLAAACLLLPHEVARLRSDAAAAAVYVTNWYLIFSHQPYFQAMGRPSLLRHLWSLAVEERFYLLWPLLFTAGMRLGRRRGMLLVALAGAAGSAILMAALYRPDTDPSRLYYGTDTRAAGLLLGATLALAWPARPPPHAAAHAPCHRGPHAGAHLHRPARRAHQRRWRFGHAGGRVVPAAGPGPHRYRCRRQPPGAGRRRAPADEARRRRAGQCGSAPHRQQRRLYRGPVRPGDGGAGRSPRDIHQRQGAAAVSGIQLPQP